MSGSITWRLPAWAGHWLPLRELAEVTAWMRANRLDRASAQRPVVVTATTITYGQDRSGPHVRAVDRDIAEVTVPLRTTPPDVRLPDLADTAWDRLGAVFAAHEWSASFGGACVTCSSTRVDQGGALVCRQEDAAPWPCPPVTAALRDAGIRVPGRGDQLRRRLANCLSPDTDAAVFGG